MAKENVDVTTGQQGQHGSSLPYNAAPESQIVSNEQVKALAVTDSRPMNPVPAPGEDVGHRPGSADIISSAPKGQSSVTATRTEGTDSAPAPITTAASEFDRRRPWIRREATLQQNGCLTRSISYGQTGMTTYHGQEMIEEPFQVLRGREPGQDMQGQMGMNGNGHYGEGNVGTDGSSSSTGATGHRTI